MTLETLLISSTLLRHHHSSSRRGRGRILRGLLLSLLVIRVRSGVGLGPEEGHVRRLPPPVPLPRLQRVEPRDALPERLVRLELLRKLPILLLLLLDLGNLWVCNISYYIKSVFKMTLFNIICYFPHFGVILILYTVYNI